MLPVSKNDKIEFTPASYENQEKKPVYLIGVPTISTRANFNRALRADGISYPNDEELMRVLRSGVKNVIHPDDQLEVLGLIDEFQSYDPADVPENVREKISELEETIFTNYRPFSNLRAQREYFLTMLPIYATKFFLRGIENGVQFESKNGVLTENCLNSIPENDVISIGWRAVSLLSPDDETKKN